MSGLRSKQADAFEELVLEAFQKKVAADVPVPPGAADIPDYSERVHRWQIRVTLLRNRE